MRRFSLVQVIGGCVLLAVSVQAQQSIGEAMRHARLAPAVDAQELTAPPASLEESLYSLYQRAGVVFAGEVMSVERTGDAVAVTFRVDDGIRNATSGGTYVLREWAGLWADDPARYVIGERRLMLLHTASVCGFASPAGGQLGAIRLHGDVAQATADLRWIAAQLATTNDSPVASAFAKASALQGEGATAVADNSAVDSMVVTSMLHAWQRSEVAQ